MGMKFACLLLFVTHILNVYAILDPTDFLALQLLRKELNDLPGSNYFESWDFTSDPCSFAGVYCNGDKVVALNLGDPRASSPGLTGRLDPAIGKLSSLVEFTVVPGRILGPLPETFSQLRNLRFLGISRNFISGGIPASFGQLRELQTLDLSFNQLTGTIPYSIGSLPVLSNVILCHNRFTGPVPSFVSSTLTRLDLKHNALSGSISPTSLPASLQFLSLSWNRLTGRVDQVLSRLNRLDYLDLSLNQFTGSIPSELFSFKLSNLQLQRNSFTGSVKPVDHVTIPTVDLSYNKLWGEVSPLFSMVQNLYLNNNKFSGRVPASFVNRLGSNIQILYLQHNYLTGIDMSPTVEIPMSISMCLQYNCMALKVQTPCPLKAGKQKTRPTQQCIEWKKSKIKN
ncbi:hypothetical protein LIER_08311 [Lithospermum erythrorhizon]|uniref:Leucine-rich repeat-containing N-terminal plant-type domain-containing protein n=1 Tax=Lithospermum erythrorhizon TaxID=34254 RepID=A0AAV3PD48_LITER